MPTRIANLVFSIGAVAILATALASPVARAQNNVDTIITNGKILTADAEFRIVQALAINEGRIVARGTIEEVSRYAGAKTQVINVAGRTVIPGLIDNHFHLTRAADTWHRQARFEGVDSRRKALEILATKAAAMPPGDWIMVQGGWTPRQFADGPGGFTLEELDRAAPRNPLFVQEGYSVVYANSLALKAVGLNPADGARRNAAGLASFQPPAKLLDAIPETSPAQREQNLTDFLHALNAAGLTGVYSLGNRRSWLRAPRKDRCRFGCGRRLRSTRRTRSRQRKLRRSSSAAVPISSTATSACSASAKCCMGRFSISRDGRSPGRPRS